MVNIAIFITTTTIYLLSTYFSTELKAHLRGDEARAYSNFLILPSQ